MAVRRLAEEQPEDFSFTPENLAWAKAKIREYPEGRQASAVIPLLWRAQEQHGGWLPEPAIRLVADLLEMPYIRVFEIATFYTMFQLQPVGSVAHVGVCGTTPCMLRGSEEIVRICRERIAPHPFALSPDGRFSWEEVECAGACVNAPMVQIGADTYEDLTPETFAAVLDALERGERPEPGPQSGRRGCEPVTGPTTLTSLRKDEAPAREPAPATATPDADVDPTSPAARAQHVARPDPRERPDVEATRATPDSPREPTTVAPEEPAEKEEASAEATRREGEAEAASADGALETARAERARAARREADRAAPGATYAAEPIRRREEAEIEPAAAPAGSRAATRRAAPAAPDSAAAERADAAGVRPEGYARGSVEKVDDLRRISGIGPVIERTLHDLGIFTFAQIAAWTPDNKEWVNAYLAFKGRIDRERWVEQARAIVEGDGE